MLRERSVRTRCWLAVGRLDASSDDNDTWMSFAWRHLDVLSWQKPGRLTKSCRRSSGEASAITGWLLNAGHFERTPEVGLLCVFPL